MKHQFGALMGLVAAVSAAPQAVTEPIPPSGSAPSGCASNFDGQFGFSIAALGSNAGSGQISCNSDAEGQLLLTLDNGVLHDRQDRTGYIASNYQFQFDGPPQAGAIYTSGFSVCSNGSIALGPSTVFYQCLSGSFYNLYDRHWAAQCEPVHFVIQRCGNEQLPGGPVTTTAVGQLPDGQPEAVPTVIAPPPVSQIPDGQIQAPPAVSQISDGQVQAPTGVASQIPDGQVQAPTAPAAPPVSQISDGQIQAPTGVASQISDGQVQAPTAPAPPPAPPVSQISDGQVQAPTTPASPPAPPVSQISDGQVQAPTGVVTQISDGQVQAPTGIATQISDGQVQAPTREDAAATPSSSAVPPSAGNKHVPGIAVVLSLSFVVVAFLL
ncbi:hypothetical protein B0I35DRAFT_191797 [Stachybotrys elegans]|uniref:Cell wall mannoprotein PIR1-like C-terminal domain-containing protein n=1 Tax=Stachybotrys elegans TaxID=80388 RepID=A0A8K0SUW3_9HYPO|nr:hypothetical protein B0I35DRAFT_191797 [Stachybotrys elegans]